MNQVPFTPMQGVYALLDQIVIGCLNRQPYLIYKSKISDVMRAALVGSRHYVVTQAVDLSGIWSMIRTEPVVTDFLMDVTSQLHLALAGSVVPFDTLINQLGAAYGATRAKDNGARANSVNTLIAVDQDLLNRMSTPSAFENLLSSNPWYAVIILMSHRSVPIFSDVRAE